MKSIKFAVLSVLFFGVMVVGRVYGEDMDMKHCNMKMPKTEVTAEKKVSEAKAKIYQEIWTCQMKDYRGENTKDEKCPKCGMKLEKELVIRSLKKEEMGKEYVCPVTGDKFKGGKVTKAADYKGKTYYFCCEMCPKQFTADPEKYIKNEDKKENKKGHIQHHK